MTEQTQPAGGRAVTVSRNDANHHYEARFDDGTVAGFIHYREQGDGDTALIHTETAPEYGGRGIASTLAGAALADIRSRGGKAVVVCPFVRAWLTKHPGEFDDIVVRAR